MMTKDKMKAIVFTLFSLCFATYAQPVKSSLGSKNDFSSSEDTSTMHFVEYIQKLQNSGSWLMLPPPPQSCSFDFSITYCMTKWDAYTNVMGIKGDYPEGIIGSMFQFIPQYGIIDYPCRGIYGNYTSNRTRFTQLNDRKWHNVTMQNGILIVDYETTFSSYNVFYTCLPPVGFGLFAACSYLGNMTEGQAEMMVSELSYTVDGVLYFDGVACRFKNAEGKWEAGLFDKITGEIYSNVGTGTLIYGPDK